MHNKNATRIALVITVFVGAALSPVVFPPISWVNDAHAQAFGAAVANRSSSFAARTRGSAAARASARVAAQRLAAKNAARLTKSVKQNAQSIKPSQITGIKKSWAAAVLRKGNKSGGGTSGGTSGGASGGTSGGTSGGGGITFQKSIPRNDNRPGIATNNDVSNGTKKLLKPTFDKAAKGTNPGSKGSDRGGSTSKDKVLKINKDFVSP